MKKLPIVALIGQTNAGKSSLLNRFARQRIAIVAREAGTTRDNVMARIDNQFLLIDTAGLKDPEDDFEASIQDQIADAIDTADLILFTIDGSKYFDHHDKNIARSALKSGKPVLMILNKSDLGETLPDTEFRALAIPPEHTYRTSATTGQGITELKRAILSELEKQFSKNIPQSPGQIHNVHNSESEVTSSAKNLPDVVNLTAADEDRFKKTAFPVPLKIALIGRPNVGKSSLFNSLAKKQQALVSSRQGTTRDVNRVTINFKKRPLEILDTAGLRRPGKREVGIEKFSALRSLAAIEEADICALLIDATEPHAKLDQSLAGQIVDAGKGIILVVTKTDLIKQGGAGDVAGGTPTPAQRQRAGMGETATAGPATVDALLADLEHDFDFLPYAPVLFTSSETGANVTKLFELALDIDTVRQQKIPTSELNKILNEAIISHPPAGLKNTKPQPKYIVQTDTNPPWFVIHGHSLGLLHWSYKRFLERKLREKYPFIGTPIFFSYYSDDHQNDRKK